VEIQFINKAFIGLRFRTDAEFLIDFTEQIRRGKARIENQRQLGIVFEFSDQGAANGSLSRANLPRNQYESDSVLDAIQEMGDGFLVLLTEKKKSRVWREIEWFLG